MGKIIFSPNFNLEVKWKEDVAVWFSKNLNKKEKENNSTCVNFWLAESWQTMS